MIIYTVRSGDSLYSIARRYDVTVDELADVNGLNVADTLVIGQAIVIPSQTVQHTVQSGESLYTIARQYGVTVQDILDANPSITNPSRISVGQVITIPAPAKLGTIDVNGYAYPTITQATLNATLPYLTYVSPFSYKVRADGSLVPLPDEAIITAARAQDVAPIMVITNILEGGSFSSDLARTILTNPQVQNTLINNIEQTLKQKNYAGLAVDFEYIYTEDREAYNQFLQNVVDRLRPQGYTISSALAPKTSANQPGLLYGAHDYPFHGSLLDHVILMTYEWGYTYGPPMAVAPINMVEKVLQYAVTAIPNEKILMGIPNYGYDWTLPYTPGTAARALSNTAAVNLARREGAEIKFDETAQSPYFNYYDNQGREHVVWFEDARSIQAKLRLVDEYNLGGVSYWTIGSFFPQNWAVLNAMFDVNKVL